MEDFNLLKVLGKGSFGKVLCQEVFDPHKIQSLVVFKRRFTVGELRLMVRGALFQSSHEGLTLEESALL